MYSFIEQTFMSTNYVPGPGTGNAKLGGSQSLPPEPTKRLDFILACVDQCGSGQSPAHSLYYS